MIPYREFKIWLCGARAVDLWSGAGAEDWLLNTHAYGDDGATYLDTEDLLAMAVIEQALLWYCKILLTYRHHEPDWGPEVRKLPGYVELGFVIQ